MISENPIPQVYRMCVIRRKVITPIKSGSNMQNTSRYRHAERGRIDQDTGSIKADDRNNDSLTAVACHPRPPHIPHVTDLSLGACNFSESGFSVLAAHQWTEGDIRI